MTPEIETEIGRLRQIFDDIGVELLLQPGASEDELATFEEKVGVQFDDHLRSLWMFSNGSGRQVWFSGDENVVHWGYVGLQFTPFEFYSIEQAANDWDLFQPYGESFYSEWKYDGDEGKTDPRVQQTFLHHKKWVPIGRFPIGSNTLYFDADPTSIGNTGQVIEYIHDPDRIEYKASSFLEFFRRSNNALELCAKVTPDGPFADMDETLAEYLNNF